MNNTIIIALTILFTIILAVSLYFLFKKKEIVIEEESKIVEIDNDLIQEEIKPMKLSPKIISNQEDEYLINRKDLQNIQFKEEIIENIESVEEEPAVNKLSINISSKTEKELLNKLNKFEEEKIYLKREVNLNFLAKEFDTNTKYLSEIIKSYKNKNFNQYLNELRIDELIRQLNSNQEVLNTRVSYLASDFGFNSHSSFTTVFTQYVGKSPSEYIKDLKNEINL